MLQLLKLYALSTDILNAVLPMYHHAAFVACNVNFHIKSSMYGHSLFISLKMKLKQVLTLPGFIDIKTGILNESKKRERNLILVACNMLKMDVKYIKCK